jgi:RNA polymerase sigma factor (sigma-70 family)
MQHTTTYQAALHRERLRAAASRRAPVDGAALEQLVKAAAAGEETAWTALSARFRAPMLRVARAHGLGTHEAEDVVQESLLSLFRSIDRVRDPAAIGAWLTTTARRESLRLLGSARRARPTDEDLGADVAAPDEVGDPLADEARHAVLERALGELPERHRRLMESLFDEQEPSYDEISRLLGIPKGSIGPIRGRCLARLRVSLAEDRETLRS